MKQTMFSELGHQLHALANRYEFDADDSRLVRDAVAALDAFAMPRVMNTQQLADALGVDAQTIRKWRIERGLPCVPLSRNVLRFKADSVLAWLDDQEQRSA